jgi:hypothetical protein
VWIAAAAVGLLAGCGGEQSVQTPSTTSTLTTELNTAPVTTTRWRWGTASSSP